MVESKLKVLMIVLSSVAPDVRVEKEARFLTQNGHNVTILAIDRKGDLLREEKRDGYKIIRFQSKKKLFFKYFEFWKNVIDYVKDFTYDIIHFHDLNVLPLASKLRKNAKVLIYDAHENFPEQMSETYGVIAYWVYTLIEKHYLKYIDGIVTAGITYSQNIKRKYGRNSIWVSNYPSLIDVELAHKKPIPDEYKKRERLRVVYFGVMYSNLGYDKVVKTANYLRDKISPENLKFLIIGSGPAYEPMKKLIEKYNLKPYFHLTGWMEYSLALSVLRTCDVGLILFQPGKNNYLRIPNRLYEYCSAGVCYIGSNFPGIREGTKYSKKFGLLVNATSPRKIAEKILYLYNNYEETEEMKKIAKEAFQKVFNWEKEAPKLLKLYNECLKKNKTREYNE